MPMDSHVASEFAAHGLEIDWRPYDFTICWKLFGINRSEEWPGIWMLFHLIQDHPAMHRIYSG